MNRNRLIWQLFPSYMLVMLLSLVAVTLFASKSLRTFYLNEKRQDLLARVRLIDGQMIPHIATGDYSTVDALAKKLGRESDTRITIILTNGSVVGDTEKDPDSMDNHADRPEVMTALQGELGSSVRYSYTIGENLMYIAVPIRKDGSIIGVARSSVTVSAINQTLMMIFLQIVMFGLVIALFATCICWVVAKRITGPLESLRDGAERFARGDFNHRISVPGCEEFSDLSLTLNNMAAQLDSRIKTVIDQRRELETILSSMNEGIVMVDTNERVITLNSRFAGLVGIAGGDAKGKMIQEVIRNTTLQRVITTALASHDVVEEDIVVDDHTERFLHVYATVLFGADRIKHGVLVVVQDVTRLRQLEMIRREFVTNVSHEIKTPLTSIKGFVETLLDGAIDNPKEAKHFLSIIEHQTDRLNQLVDDLLVLSKVQRDAEKKEVTVSHENLRSVVDSAVGLCEMKATKKNISITVQCDEHFTGMVNALLLEQALVNLIDNAIKYSPEKSSITIQVERKSDELVFVVADQGSGIPPEHLPRLFERFYRVDKGRSRQLGGTGLGLAIVKHIARAHEGTVSVDSVVGKGTSFAIHLPVATAR